MQEIKISLTACRVNARLSQKELAEKLDVSMATIGNWESGKSEPPVSKLRIISELSGIPMDYIFVPTQSESFVSAHGGTE